MSKRKLVNRKSTNANGGKKKEKKPLDPGSNQDLGIGMNGVRGITGKMGTTKKSRGKRGNRLWMSRASHPHWDEERPGGEGSTK